MLEGVVQRGTAAYSVGAQIDKPLAGKTGTSQDAQSTWFIGFSPDLAAGVYVGFDNPRTLGPKEQGATVAAPIFRDFMKEALTDAPPTPFRVAPGIEEVPIDWKSGNPVAARHARRDHGSLQGRHRAGRSQCAGPAGRWRRRRSRAPAPQSQRTAAGRVGARAPADFIEAVTLRAAATALPSSDLPISAPCAPKSPAPSTKSSRPSPC